MDTPRWVIPVSESRTLRNTVAYVIGETVDRLTESDSSAQLHFVYPLSGRVLFGEDTAELTAANQLLERIRAWTEEDAGEYAEQIEVSTEIIGQRDYLFDPGDYADVIIDYARTHDLEKAVFDPEYNPVGTMPLLPPLQGEVRRAGLTVEEAPIQRPRQPAVLVRRGTVEQFLALFGTTYVFYLLLAGSLDSFELVTGAISAGVVAVALWRVSLTGPLSLSRAARQSGRLLVYSPYLLWEIAKANLQIAYVVLHPALPIDPELVEFDAAVWASLPVTTLANSITLTPGTLTVDVERRHFTVHALTGSSRESLLAGGLERGVRFVFYGLKSARIPSPAERRQHTVEEDAE